MISVSIAFCVPALLLLQFYNGGHLQKLRLIRNLVAAILLRNIFVLISQTQIVMDELTTTSGEETTAMGQNEWPCKLLATLERVATNAVFTCMLLEAIFLHQLITNVFGSRGQDGINMFPYYIVGAGMYLVLLNIVGTLLYELLLVLVITITTAVAWAITIALYADEHCWIVSDSRNFHWINDSPRLIMLVICTILLCHIMYVLWKSFHNTQNEHRASL